MTNFPIEPILEHLKKATVGDLKGVEAAFSALRYLKEGATSITTAKRLTESDDPGLEVWEVTLEMYGPPDLSCVYALIPFPRPPGRHIGPSRA